MILSLIAAAALCLPAQSQQRTVTERDSLGHTTRIIEVLDTVRDGRAETDTLSITTYEEPAERTFTGHSVDYQWDITDWENLGDKAVAFSAMVAFGMFLFFITPVVLIILIFYFRNKNRKRKYLLLQQTDNPCRRRHSRKSPCRTTVQRASRTSAWASASSSSFGH